MRRLAAPDLDGIFLWGYSPGAGPVAPAVYYRRLADLASRSPREIWRTLDALQEKLADSDGQARMLSACEELTGQLERHNSKEEPIFYTQADRAVTGVQSAQLEDFLRSGQMPLGWICQAVRP